MWTRNYGALGQTARVCFGVLCANKKKEEVKRDFGDLRIRRSEGHVVNTPLVLKRVLFEETRGDRKKKGEREKEEKRARKREGRIVGGRGEENPRVLLGDADQESETRMRKNALRTGRRQAVESRPQSSAKTLSPFLTTAEPQLLDIRYQYKIG
ncbi:hypothetical protein TNCV_3165081 [Trichonephila clavipes]|nr:hypothetical protein TNCV_3165081 [Trichonephila clavipes]